MPSSFLTKTRAEANTFVSSGVRGRLQRFCTVLSASVPLVIVVSVQLLTSCNRLNLLLSFFGVLGKLLAALLD